DANWDQVKVTFPNVKEGSVVEISYRVNSPFLTNFQDWSFQTTIPTILSEYRGKIPEYFSYDKYLQGYVGLATNDEKRENNSIRFAPSAGQAASSLDFVEHHYRWVATHV